MCRTIQPDRMFKTITINHQTNMNKKFNPYFCLIRLSLAAGILAGIFCWTGCSPENGEKIPRDVNERKLADHSLLVYFVADNNLSNYATNNFEKISEAYFSKPDNNRLNLFVYMDNLEGNPRLYWLDPEYGTNVLKEYPETNSASASTIRDICATTFRSGKRGKTVNSVIFWSHGTNWLQAYNPTGNRSFGDDDGYHIDIADMAKAIEGLSINNILFDACYMGSTEVAAEFSAVADVLVGSPCEILSTGFPYHTIIQALCSEKPDMHKVVDSYHEFYDTQDGIYRAGALTSIDLSGIRNLANAFGRLKYASFGDNSVQGLSILSYDRERTHLFHDIRQFAELCHEKAVQTVGKELADRYLEDFDRAYRGCNVHTRMTDRFLGIDMRGGCGLTVFVPRPETYPPVCDFYRTLRWYGWCIPDND